jgi:hypothetical protein
MAVVTPLNNPGGPEGDTVTVDEQLLNTEYSHKQTWHCGGGLSLQTLSSEKRLRRAPFLTVLMTHSVSRSFPLTPQRMQSSLAAVSVAAGPASHSHPVASKHHTCTQHVV